MTSATDRSRAHFRAGALVELLFPLRPRPLPPPNNIDHDQLLTSWTLYPRTPAKPFLVWARSGYICCRRRAFELTEKDVALNGILTGPEAHKSSPWNVVSDVGKTTSFSHLLVA